MKTKKPQMNNEEKYFDEEIVPLLNKLRTACKKKTLPSYIILVQFSQDGYVQSAELTGNQSATFEQAARVLSALDILEQPVLVQKKTENLQ